MAGKGYMTVVEAPNFNAIIDEMVESIIQEAIKHFLKQKPIKKPQIQDDPRYFYSKKELDCFLAQFNQKCNPDNPNHHLLVENVLDNNNCFLCFKVYR